VAPIAAIGESNGPVFELPVVNRMASTLREALLDIQEGRVADPFNWTVDAADGSILAQFLESGPVS
jgi:hypothetical protein